MWTVSETGVDIFWCIRHILPSPAAATAESEVDLG